MEFQKFNNEYTLYLFLSRMVFLSKLVSLDTDFRLIYGQSKM